VIQIRCAEQSCNDRTVTESVSVRALTHRSGLDVRLAFPGPRQEFVDPVYGMPSDHAGDHILEVSVGLDAVELAGLDQ